MSAVLREIVSLQVFDPGAGVGKIKLRITGLDRFAGEKWVRTWMICSLEPEIEMISWFVGPNRAECTLMSFDAIATTGVLLAEGWSYHPEFTCTMLPPHGTAAADQHRKEVWGREKRRRAARMIGIMKRDIDELHSANLSLRTKLIAARRYRTLSQTLINTLSESVDDARYRVDAFREWCEEMEEKTR